MQNRSRRHNTKHASTPDTMADTGLPRMGHKKDRVQSSGVGEARASHSSRIHAKIGCDSNVTGFITTVTVLTEGRTRTSTLRTRCLSPSSNLWPLCSQVYALSCTSRQRRQSPSHWYSASRRSHLARTFSTTQFSGILYSTLSSTHCLLTPNRTFPVRQERADSIRRREGRVLIGSDGGN